ncbi:stage VI sporulation protein D [Ornithinibacillus scapharcae]|uniref:stage VI sporulation protein D n=1 Tax=Ornithinibacillus scapharcae TaxID=1147159 RepID=UPI000225BF5A|nr:stage VI sporulation protein D [Ornithinibacillus scapharcae]
MVNEQSVFRFDLNESLYFEKGQEVDEIMGISLEPEISIQELNDYISIRGVVELQGSYQKAEHTGEEEEDSYYDGYDSKRYMERVFDTEHGAAEFMHRFPVEITVPSNRVNNLDDVSVMIAEFDYELPESNHLYLRSTIEIHGINSHVQEATSEDKLEEESIHESTELMERDMEESFEFEVQQEDESSSYIEDSPEQLPTLSEQESQDESESGRWKFTKEKTQTFDEFFQTKEEPQVSSEEVEESSSSFMEEYVDISLEESDDSREEKADLTYLADIFRTEEEEFTKVKVRIVQEKDTLEALAEKYETSTMLIRNQNRLEDDDLTEGQLLYIPTKK